MEDLQSSARLGKECFRQAERSQTSIILCLYTSCVWEYKPNAGVGTGKNASRDERRIDVLD